MSGAGVPGCAAVRLGSPYAYAGSHLLRVESTAAAPAALPTAFNLSHRDGVAACCAGCAG